MEPMALGSAPSSPVTSPGPNPNYLPAFLMGDVRSKAPTQPVNILPENQGSYLYNLSPTDTTHQYLLNSSLNNTRAELSTSAVSPQPPFDVSARRAGPPKQGLFDTLETKSGRKAQTFGNLSQSFLTEPNTSYNDNYLSSSPGNDLLCNASMANDSFSKNNSFNNFDIIKSEHSQNLWVTVFGFPSSCTSLVLARFAGCGTIVDKRFPTQGNWVHLKFSSPSETANALTLNGKLVSNNVMVGVVPHQVKSANEQGRSDTPIYATPIRARSLRHSFVSPQNSNNTVLPPQNVPQKSTSLVSKAMEYVLGW